MSTQGAPRVPVWTGSSTFLPAALSCTHLMSDTGDLLDTARHRPGLGGAAVAGGVLKASPEPAIPCAQVSHSAAGGGSDRGQRNRPFQARGGEARQARVGS